MSGKSKKGFENAISSGKVVGASVSDVKVTENLARQIAEDSTASPELRNLVAIYARELDSPYVQENSGRREAAALRFATAAARLENAT